MIFQRAALFLCSSLLFPGIATTVAATLDVTDADVKHSASIISWLKTKKGYFNPKLEMRRIDPSDPTSIFGMFAKEDISEDHSWFVSLMTSFYIPKKMGSQRRWIAVLSTTLLIN